MTREETRDEILNMSNPNILCELPTGYGKTRVALDLMNKLFPNTNTIKTGLLIVIPRLVLIDNWKDEFVKWGYQKYLPYVEFVTYVSLPKKAGTWDYVIFDECHHLSERCLDSLDSFDIKHSILLSATVKRDLRESLKLIFKDLGMYKVRIKEAIQEEVLPDPRVYLIPLFLDSRTTNYTIIKNKSKGNPITINYIDRFKWKNVKNRKIIIRCTQTQCYNDQCGLIEWYRRRGGVISKKLYLKACGDRLKWLSDQKTSYIKTLLDHLSQERTLTFCNSIAQTEELGTNCINSKNKESLHILEDFNNGRVAHITACNMLDEGVNLTGCRVGIYAVLNSSERLIKQKLGRLLRHKDPIIIIPYYKYTRDEEIIKKMCEDYNPELVTTISNINEITL